MSETILRDRLLATVPALDDADWLDVRRRARAIEAPRRRNRRLLAIAAVLAILTALVVNPALGIGERLLDFVEGDPAPENVKRRLAEGADHPPLRVGHRVIERPEGPKPDLVGARLAVALDSSIGKVYLWAAPTDDRRGTCTALQLEGHPSSSGNCGTAPSADLPIVGTGAGDLADGDRSITYIQGQVRADIARLEVTLSSGRVVELRLVDGFFVAELPRGVRPLEYRGFDAGGSSVARLRLPDPSPHRIRPVEPYREALSIRLTSGREARLEYARAEDGRLCWRLFWGAQSSGTCGPVRKRSLPSVMTSGTGRNQTVLLQGPVGADIARVDLVWDDGTIERLLIEQGFVLKQIDPYGARFPSKLVGRDEAGRIVRERPAFGPG
jgi:hypothetical protein